MNESWKAMSQESNVCCTTSIYDIQNRCIPDEFDLFYFKTCIRTHNNNIIEQNINVSMFDILSVKEPHMYACCFVNMCPFKQRDMSVMTSVPNFIL